MVDLKVFDFETWGAEPPYALEPWRHATGHSWVTTSAIARRNAQGRWVSRGYAHVPVDYAPNPLMLNEEAIHSYFENTSSIYGGWNVVFDLQWLIAYGFEEYVFNRKWLDIMSVCRHAIGSSTKRSGYGLKETVTTFLPEYAGYEEAVEYGATSVEGLETLLKYNRLDVVLSGMLFDLFWPQLSKAQQTACKLESACLTMVARTNYDGLVVNLDAAYHLKQSMQSKRETAYRELESVIENIRKININSNAQMATLLFDTLGMTPLKHSPRTGLPSADKETLHELATEDEWVAKLRTIRDTKTTETKFADSTIKCAAYHEASVVRPQARVFGTVTGRMTYSSKTGKGKSERPVGVALHQWQRGKDTRNIIAAPEGYVLVEYDFAGQEYRWMAVFSGDENMLNMCMPGEDGHSFMGASISEEDYKQFCIAVKQGVSGYSDKRKLGKVANLSCQYRTSAPKLRSVARVQYFIPMSQMEAEKIHDMYQRTYPGVKHYWRSSIDLAKQRGYAETAAGRRLIIEGNWRGRDSWSMGSNAINTPIQGSGADQKYLALAVAKDMLIEMRGKFYYELHDGLFFVLPKDSKLESNLIKLGKTLSNLPYKQAWGIDLPIKFPVDCKYGASWGDMKEFDFNG